MRKTLSLVVVGVLLAGIVALATGFPATAAKDPVLPGKGRQTIRLFAQLNTDRMNVPYVVNSWQPPGKNQVFVVESVSRTVSWPVGTTISNSLAVGAPPVVPDQYQGQWTFALDNWPANPIQNYANVSNNFSDPPCPTGFDSPQAYYWTSDTNELNLVVNPGQQLGIFMLYAGNTTPGCQVRVTYYVTGHFEPAS